MTGVSLARRAAVEAVGTAFLLVAVVGSGIMAERLAGGNAALALLANSCATGAALVALVLALGPISGAHLNPAVTLAHALTKRARWRDAAAYAGAQVAGAFAGVALAHAMFGLPIFFASQRVRTGAGQWLAETVASFGLLLAIFGSARRHSDAVAWAVGAYIAGAYWFTASTSFANPAVALARAASDTFAGIRPADAPAFVAAELLGSVLACAFWRCIEPPEKR